MAEKSKGCQGGCAAVWVGLWMHGRVSGRRLGRVSGEADHRHVVITAIACWQTCQAGREALRGHEHGVRGP